MTFTAKCMTCAVFGALVALCALGVLRGLSQDGFGVATWSGIQALGTFLAFGAAFWYASIARQQSETFAEQLKAMQTGLAKSDEDLKIARAQLQITEGEVRKSDALHRQDRKPVVFLDVSHHPERGDNNYELVIRNVGGGFAVNVYFIAGELGSVQTTSLGGLGAGAEAVVKHPLAVKRGIILAEAVPSRARRWNPTFNWQVSSGVIAHALSREPSGPAVQDLEADMELEEYINGHIFELMGELSARIASTGGA